MWTVLAVIAGTATLIGLFRAARRAPQPLPPDSRVGEQKRATKTHPPISVTGLKVDLHIRYRDAENHPSRRRITVHNLVGRIEADGAAVFEVIHAYCHTRRAARTFRVDRIAEAADTDGVVIRNLQDWLRQQTQR